MKKVRGAVIEGCTFQPQLATKPKRSGGPDDDAKDVPIDIDAAGVPSAAGASTSAACACEAPAYPRPAANESAADAEGVPAGEEAGRGRAPGARGGGGGARGRGAGGQVERAGDRARQLQ